MGYLPEAFPAVTPNLDDAPFWAHCAGRRLAFQRCAACRAMRHPPSPICGACQSDRVEWIDAPPRGRLFTWTVTHHPTHPAAKEAVPYNVVLIDFPDLPGVRLVSNIIDAGAGELVAGAEVALVWETDAGGQCLPRFRLVRDGDGRVKVWPT